MLIDSHCHLYIDRPQDEIPQVLERARSEGVLAIICPAIDLASAETCIRLAQAFSMVHAAAGIHPNYTAEVTEDDLGKLKKLLSQPGVVALGEIGLDYYREFAPFDLQRKWFQSQLELAGELDLPVIIHNRNADNDVLDTLRSVGISRGVAHCFSSSCETADAFLDLGFYISFAGNLTFKNSDLPEVARKLPLERILVETDTPYLSPVPFRGKPNEPARVRLVAEKLAEIFHRPVQAVIQQTTENTRDLFSI